MLLGLALRTTYELQFSGGVSHEARGMRSSQWLDCPLLGLPPRPEYETGLSVLEKFLGWSVASGLYRYRLLVKSHEASPC